MRLLIILIITLEFVPNILAALPREKVADEITPLSAEHSNTWYGTDGEYGANRAIDMDYESESYTGFDQDGNTWLQLTLDGVHCVTGLIRYWNDGSEFQSWTCSDTQCTCDGDYCDSWSLTVSTTGTVTNNPPTVTDCKYGDTVRYAHNNPNQRIGIAEVAVLGREIQPPEPVQCNVLTNNGDLEAADCIEGLTTCTSPVVVPYSGMSDQEYGCGSCTDSTTCVECEATSAAPCNTRVDPGRTFTCFSYVWEGSEWVTVEEITCSAPRSTAVICNKPGENADGDYMKPNGCGPCADGAVDAGTCVQCDGDRCSADDGSPVDCLTSFDDSCNSAATLSFFIVPLIIAILFNIVY